MKKEQPVSPLEKWTVSDPPREDSDAWRTSNRATREWQVVLQNGRVAVRPYDEHTPEQIRLPFVVQRKWMMDEPKAAPGTCLYDKKKAVKVADGWLLFVNAGEWGGRVDWFSPNGTQHYKISTHQIADYAQTPEGLFAVQGLAHMGYRGGTLIKLAHGEASRWKASTLVDLQDAPYALLPEGKDTFLVVTSAKLVRVHIADKTVTPLLEKAFWWGMYPNSLVAAPNGDFYVGMRGGVARVTRTSGAYKVRWLTPPA